MWSRAYIAQVLTISGVAHVALTVRNLPKSETWYHQVLGFDRVREIHERHFDAVVLGQAESGLTISLRQHHGASTARFDETRTGLDHVALAVGDRQDLDRWVAQLDELHVEHSPVTDAGWGSVVVLRDPDHIQLELCCPTTPAE